ncbi:DUF5908 family protein [Stigmatella aurantiaca]|uniref:Conserved uncharacterized protein n=1 Tax=Stigmatella aurantiaca (strain DW4/3-1) TaxID=378806 RepID=Q09DG0_STIAD|nr:DUF5908 family protein [Stigmatella aurantiaca]ADO69351.1 conserved uncharacterized protein [Stigmatella aurantiaca DW4/3-1]EAU69823.1 hypothetical protein STIAU_1524 [Stigmatella aurantiaca DW4/3-1]
MPIEIRELVIRAVVGAPPAPGRGRLREEDLERLKRELVAECLERLAEERAAKGRR